MYVVAFPKANPQKLDVGIRGNAAGLLDYFVCSYLLEKAAESRFQLHRVQPAAGEVNAALMGGHIDAAVSNPGEALELARQEGSVCSGSIRRSG